MVEFKVNLNPNFVDKLVVVDGEWIEYLVHKAEVNEETFFTPMRWEDVNPLHEEIRQYVGNTFDKQERRLRNMSPENSIIGQQYANMIRESTDKLLIQVTTVLIVLSY